MQNELTNQDVYQVLSLDELEQTNGGRPGGFLVGGGPFPICGPIPTPYTDPVTGITILIC